MTYTTAIIGANFGDEGKGLATDYFTRKLFTGGIMPTVIRGNGGAQAGHTVDTGDKRHVFGHYGAGTFAGAPTYLASNFIVNPYQLQKETKELEKMLNWIPQLRASLSCRVTTIYDMALNSLAELSRGQRHGSCGMGINETVTRHLAGFELTMEDVKNDNVYQALIDIKRRWVPKRLAQVLLQNGPITPTDDFKQYMQILQTDPLSVSDDLAICAARIDTKYRKQYESGGLAPAVYEGAQGLMLDEFLGEFPHVTRSVTGLASAVLSAAELGHRRIKPVYMTRCYATRHGAGPLMHEGHEITNANLVDTTNVPNDWQGMLRYAPLDIPSMALFIKKDLMRAEFVAQMTGTTIEKPQVFVTCMDQLGGYVNIVSLHGVTKLPTGEFLAYLSEVLNLDVGWASYGPEAKDVIQFPKGAPRND